MLLVGMLALLLSLLRPTIRQGAGALLTALGTVDTPAFASGTSVSLSGHIM